MYASGTIATVKEEVLQKDASVARHSFSQWHGGLRRRLNYHDAVGLYNIEKEYMLRDSRCLRSKSNRVYSTESWDRL